MNFIDQYPNDHETQLRLLDELDKYLSDLTPEKLFSPRFKFLLQYWKKNDTGFLKEICTNWIERIENV